MKKLLLSYIFFFIVSALSAQTVSDVVSYLNIGSGSLRIMAGIRFLPANSEDSVYLKYIDASPSHDSLFTFIDISQTQKALAYSIGYDVLITDKLLLSIAFEGFINTYYTLGGTAGLHYLLFSTEKGTQLTAGATLGGGIGRYKLGTVDNNSLYFQIGDILIYDASMDMKYTENFWSFSPQINFFQPIGESLRLVLNAQYNLGIRRNTTIAFYGSEGNLSDPGAPNATLPLDDVNVSFLQANQELNKLPLNYSGPSISLGVSYLF